MQGERQEERMAQYLLLVFKDESAVPACGSPAWEQSVAAHQRFIAWVVAGPSALLGSSALEPSSTATTVRADVITDGPFAETKQALGGFSLLEADDLDEALRVAGLCPALGCVEVRPVLPLS